MRRIAIVFVLASTACTHVRFSETNAPPRALAARPRASVEIFTLGPPQRPFKEIGMIESQTDIIPGQNPLDALREEAALHGCDGLVVTGSNDATGSDPTFGTYVLKGYRGTCVVWTEDLTASNAPAASTRGGRP
jgi:hypothetical protein